MAGSIVALCISTVFLAAQFCASDSAARCGRTWDREILCKNIGEGAVKRLPVYYNDDVSLIVKNSSLPILKNDIFKGLNHLEKLTLTNCGVRTIEDNALRGLNLTHLKLARNFLSHIPPKLFHDLTELAFLDLSKNFISHIEFRATEYGPPKLRYLDISGNMLRGLTFLGNFSELETVNFENNSALREIRADSLLNFPKIREIFFRGNSFNGSYNDFARRSLKSAGINTDSEHPVNNVRWNYLLDEDDDARNAEASFEESRRSMNDEIGKEFKLSPEQIKALDSSQLRDLVSKILMLRNFTIHERKMLEMDRRRIEEESRSVKSEANRVEQIKKRVNEIIGKAREESRAEYIEKNCHDIPNDTWWNNFKRWNCKNLYSLIGKIVGREK
ncbi:uncharacterized protein LOC105691727 [Athalia rosae]|uniref:uncharacterized protein LOC105691727 n=1 Tax=Athalia rosae TaxID=37344 RepID=UPI002034A17A|nr:uncharacterized protein LOC105691727 [Athalia rosae]